MGVLTTTELQDAERFPHLSRSPIVEAVIEFRARVELPWNEADVTPRLKSALPEYPKGNSLHAVSFQTQFRLGGHEGESVAESTGPATALDRGWSGLRLMSNDGKYIAAFTRESFSLSRLHPYKSWDVFKAEALRLWNMHVLIAGISDVERIGTRCINRFSVPTADLRIGDYLRDFAGAAGGLPVGGFLHQDVLVPPGRPYTVNLIRTMQPSEQPNPATLALIVDIDVGCPEAVAIKDGTTQVETHLAAMHLLRNRVFFGSVTDPAMELFR